MRDDDLVKYRALIEERPGWFVNGPDHPIEILTGDTDIAAAQGAAEAAHRARNEPATWARVGVVHEDGYMRFLRDAVRFPSGSLGTYIRIMPPARGPDVAGAAVLPIHQDHALLLRQYRHATRQWHIEMPRGFAEPSETCEATARRELDEEIGGEVERIQSLGLMHTNTGISAEIVHLFQADMLGFDPERAKREWSELVRVPIEQVQRMIASGEITDSFTLAAWSRCVAMGLLPLGNKR